MRSYSVLRLYQNQNIAQYDGLFACVNCGAEYGYECICKGVFVYKGKTYNGPEILSLELIPYDESVVRTLAVGEDFLVDCEALRRIM